MQSPLRPARPTLSPAVRAYVSVDAPLIALTHVRVIDGTGAAPRENQTLILNNGIITTMGSSASTDVPPARRRSISPARASSPAS